MSPRNCFGVILRTIGLIALTASALYIYSTIVVLLHPSAANEFSILSYLFATVITFAIGLYFLKGAPHLINFAYGRTDSLDYGTEIIDSGAEVAKQQLHLCSFCGKSHAEVKKLIQGPGVWICDNCVTVCRNTLVKELTQNKPSEKAPPETPPPKP